MASPSLPVVSVSGDGRRRVYRRSDPDRFWSKVDRAAPDECWIWTGSRRKTGYGTFLVPRDGARVRGVVAHRWAYESMAGPIPAGYEIDHLCRVRECVNPCHLEAVTRKMNNDRKINPPPFRLTRDPMPMPVPDLTVPKRERREVTVFRTHCRNGHEYAVTGFVVRGLTRRGKPARTCAACYSEQLRRQYVRHRTSR
jgi:hypothetical protein